MNRTTKHITKGLTFAFNKSLYVDDTAFLFLSRNELETGSKITVRYFKRFGLTVHLRNNNKQEPSKTEAMFFPKPNNKTDPSQTQDIILNDDGDCFTFTTNFK